MAPEPLVFGVYPFGIVGGPNGPVAGPPDDIGRIGQALTELAGGGPPLPVRMYVTYEGDVDAALGQAAQFAQIGRLVDLSLNFHDPAGDVPRWRTFVDAVVRRHGAQVGSIGVTNEANLRNVPFAPDGAYPNAWEALVGGVLAAAVPIRVNECGWPTGPGRGEDDQARVLTAIILTVAGLRSDFNVTHWELFSLRDADSDRDDVLGGFGILRDDYTPKPAFAALRDAIRSTT